MTSVPLDPTRSNACGACSEGDHDEHSPTYVDENDVARRCGCLPCHLDGLDRQLDQVERAARENGRKLAEVLARLDSSGISVDGDDHAAAAANFGRGPLVELVNVVQNVVASLDIAVSTVARRLDRELPRLDELALAAL